MNASKKMTQRAGGSQDDISRAYRDIVERNKAQGLSPILEDNVWEGGKIVDDNPLALDEALEAQGDKMTPPNPVWDIEKGLFRGGEEIEDDMFGVDNCIAPTADKDIICPTPPEVVTDQSVKLVSIAFLESRYNFLVRARPVVTCPIVHLSWNECTMCDKPCDCLHTISIGTCQNEVRQWEEGFKFVTKQQLPIFSILCHQCWNSCVPQPAHYRMAAMTKTTREFPAHELPVNSTYVQSVFTEALRPKVRRLVVSHAHKRLHKQNRSSQRGHKEAR